jgi:prolyl 4-hydroxylase
MTTAEVKPKAELAVRLLTGPEATRDPARAADLLRVAGEHGDGEALALLATLAGVGLGTGQSWPASLGHLAAAATLGSATARSQLLALTDAPAPSEDRAAHAETWRDLAQRIDIGAWLTAPARINLCEAPRVRMAERFVSPRVCDWLIQRARGRMRPALMYDGATRVEQLDPHRTCSDYEFDLLNTDVVLLLTRERIAALTKLPTIAMEPPRVFHYALGEEIKPHYDRCGDGVAGYGQQGGYLGDRIVTFLLYLNDGFEGGELYFPKTGFRRKGAKGDAIYFAHVEPAGKPDPLSLHGGDVIRAGEKWVLSQWIHDRPFGVVGP